MDQQKSKVSLKHLSLFGLGRTLLNNLAITWTFEYYDPLPFGGATTILLGETRDLKFCMDRLFSLEKQ